MSYYEEEKNTTTIFYEAIEIVVNCIRNRFQQKDLFETLEAMKILFLKVLHEEDFGHELSANVFVFSSDLHKFKLETQLKTLTHINDEKNVGIKDFTTVKSILIIIKWISKTVSEVLKLVKLISTVTATRSSSTLRRFKTYL